MCQSQYELDRRGIQVRIVTFEKRWRAEAYRQETRYPWPILLDPNRALYQAYGMERGSSWRVLGLQNWLYYLKLMWKGQKVKRPTDDIYQLGGDVLIDPQGTVRFHFVSESPIDRPSVVRMLAIVDQP